MIMKEEAPEWIEILDPGSGRWYYYNNHTGVSQWEQPPGFQKIGDYSKLRSLMAPELRATLLIQQTWRAKVARKNVRIQRGRTAINVNKTVNDTPWQKLNDPSSGYDYWYNMQTGEVTWNEPAMMEMQPAIEEEDEEEKQEECNADRLPEWVEMFDPASNRRYYFNNYTFESQWEKPDAYTLPDMSKFPNLQALWSPELKAALLMQQTWRAKIARRDVRKQRAATSKHVTESPSVWQKFNDPATGYDYWYNSETQEVTWNQPIEEEGQPIEKEKRSEDAWIEMYDPRSGKPYFLNQVTFETTWTRPEAMGETEERLDYPTLKKRLVPKVKLAVLMQNAWRANVARQKVRRQRAKTSKRLQTDCNWGRFNDPVTGYDYYYNYDTEQVTWEKPAGVSIQEPQVQQVDVVDDDNGASPIEKNKNNEDTNAITTTQETKEKEKVNNTTKETMEKEGTDAIEEKEIVNNTTGETKETEGPNETTYAAVPIVQLTESQSSKKLISVPDVQTKEKEGPKKDEMRSHFRSNNSIRRIKKQAQEEKDMVTNYMALNEKLVCAELCIEITSSRLIILKDLFMKSREFVPRKQSKILVQVRSADQSIRVAELAIAEAAQEISETRPKLERLKQTIGALKEAESSVIKASKASVFSEAQLVVAVRSCFGIHAELAGKFHEMYDKILDIIEARTIHSISGLRSRLRASESAVHEAKLRVKYVDGISQRNFAKESIQTQRVAEMKKRRKSLAQYESTPEMELMDLLEEQRYAKLFAKMQEDFAGDEQDDGINTILDQVANDSPWWPSYFHGFTAVLAEAKLVRDLDQFVTVSIEAMNQQKEARLMLAEEASQRAVQAARKGASYERECREKFIALCRESWQRGLDIRYGNKKKGSNDRKPVDPKSDPFHDVHTNAKSIVRTDVFSSPWEACESNCSLDAFKVALEDARARREYQEGKRFDVDTPDLKTSRILLQTAVWYGRKDIVAYLLHIGANPDAIRSSLDPTTALHVAIRASHPDIAKLLLGAGAYILAKDYAGENALHWACRMESMSSVRLLLQYAKELDHLAQREEDDERKRDSTYYKLVGALDNRGRTPTELLKRQKRKDAATGDDNLEALSYTGKRIYELLRKEEIEAQKRLLHADMGKLPANDRMKRLVKH